VLGRGNEVCPPVVLDPVSVDPAELLDDVRAEVAPLVGVAERVPVGVAERVVGVGVGVRVVVRVGAGCSIGAGLPPVEPAVATLSGRTAR
jgi:hypothetical protein